MFTLFPKIGFISKDSVHVCDELGAWCSLPWAQTQLEQAPGPIEDGQRMENLQQTGKSEGSQTASLFKNS